MKKFREKIYIYVKDDNNIVSRVTFVFVFYMVHFFNFLNIH